MASGTEGVWAIDIGNNSLKALHLREIAGAVEVIGLANINHDKILSGGGISDDERDELIALSLRRFVDNNDLGKEDIIVSVPSQNSFARFVKLPPVDKKRIPEIVRFEAAQQIPFDIDEVQWDWQLIDDGQEGERRVGIFAIKNEVISSSLEHFEREGIEIGFVQMAPMALYNYLCFDRPELVSSDTRGTVVLNIGAENTDLVVCTKSAVWQRCIPMGGNSFTQAIAETFKLKFQKAEKLKRTAAMSKYARQILQTMKPVFTDLSSEIQRSLGFYRSSNPNVKVTKIIALGGGTNMRGLLKYLQQSLQIPIERPDSFKNLLLGSDISEAKFHEHICDFGVVYGLGLQGIGLGKIESNLLPSNIARSMAWSGKSRYFNIAACMLLVVAILGFVRATMDKVNYEKKKIQRQKISSVIRAAKNNRSLLQEQESKSIEYEEMISNAYKPFKYRDVIPKLQETILSVMPNATNTPEQKELYDAFAANDIEAVLKTPRNERKQIFITGMSIYFANEIETAGFAGVDLQQGKARKTMDTAVSGYDPMSPIMFPPGMFPEMDAPKYAKETPKDYGPATGKPDEDQKGGPGFIISIAGYGPYKELRELMDPIGVEDDRTRWGIITRLLHLDEIVDGNSPFELYRKTEAKHFKQDYGEVKWEGGSPIGVGIEGKHFDKPKGQAENEEVLIDPMTKEIISKIVKLDKEGNKLTDRQGNVVYQVNDHWFTLDFKLTWKEAPEELKVEKKF